MQHCLVKILANKFSLGAWLASSYFALGCLIPSLAATERVALVVGNARYETAVGPLRNSQNDAKAMAQLLKTLGFQVIERHNVTRDDLIKAMISFRTALATADIGLFYYAGHGLAVAGSNYLVPLKSGYQPEGLDPTTQRLLAETHLFNVEQAVADMKSAGGHCHLVILDACRSTPLNPAGRTRDVVARGGLAEMAPPAGSLVAFATDSGHTAYDGDAKHGLYTEELMRHLQTPGLTIEQVFKRTRASVLERSAGGQMPAEYSRLVGEDIYLAGKAPLQPSPIVVPTSTPTGTNPLDILRLAKAGLAVACGEQLRAQAERNGPFSDAVEPLSILLEGVKEDLKSAEAPSPKVIASAETCTLILDLLQTVVPPGHERLGELTAKALNRRGDALLLLAQPEAALKDFEAALSLTDEDAYIFYNRGCALLALGREQGALLDFQRAANPTHPQPGAKRLAEQALKRLASKKPPF